MVSKITIIYKNNYIFNEMLSFIKKMTTKYHATVLNIDVPWCTHKYVPVPTVKHIETNLVISGLCNSTKNRLIKWTDWKHVVISPDMSATAINHFRIFHFTIPKIKNKKNKKIYVMFQNKVLSFSVVGGRFWLQFSGVHCGPALQSNENMPSSLIHVLTNGCNFNCCIKKKFSWARFELMTETKGKTCFARPKHIGAEPP